MLGIIAQAGSGLGACPVVVFNQDQVSRPNPKRLADFARHQFDSVRYARPITQAVSEVCCNHNDSTAARIHSEPAGADLLVVIVILQDAVVRNAGISPLMYSAARHLPKQ